jgi:DNA-binding transcriptional LysR family regulator
METNRLRQFCTVVETGNLRKAATLLGISHSGLFKSLKTLETELGFPLFLPSGRGIVVTDQGKHLYDRSGSFFSQLDHLVGKTKAPTKKLIRLGSFEVFTSHFVGKFLKDQKKETPTESEIEVHELIPGRLEEALLLGKVDLGITYDPVPRPGIDYVRVTHISMGAYALKGAFRGMDCQSIPFVVPVTPLESMPSGVKGMDAWPEDRFKRNICYRVDLMNTGLELVRQGLCAIFIPRFVAKLHNDSIRPELRLEERALPKGMPEIKREVYLVKRESTEENSILKKIAHALREIS